MNIIYGIYPYTIYVDKGRLSKRGNTGKFQAGNRYTNELSKTLEEFPPVEEEYPGKLLSANRNTN
jgi:hypothetical protein